MAGRSSSLFAIAIFAWTMTSRADAPPPREPVGNAGPVLSVEAGGPTASVTSLAFSPDGTTLYAAGYDKIIRSWKLDKDQRRFVLQDQTFRIPIGPGTTGVINVLAISPDGEWLAASGLGLARNVQGFQKPGRIYPVAGVWTAEMYEDQATIYLFHTKGTAVAQLRGHRGRVLSMAFATGGEEKSLQLASAAAEPDVAPARQAGANGYRGRVVLWDVGKAVSGNDQTAKANVAEWTYPKVSREVPLPPGIAVRRTGTNPKNCQVAMAWRDGRLRIWDAEKGTVREEADGDERWNGAATYSASGTLLTTSARAEKSQLIGRLQSWDNGPEGAPKRGASFRLPPPQGATGLWPCGLTLVSGTNGGKADHAAVVCLLAKGSGTELEFDYSLMLVELSNGRIDGHVLLWGGRPGERPTEPVIAASSAGEHIAIAGEGPHRVLVYSVRDLLRDKNDRQALDSLGYTARSIAFVQEAANAESLGLLLSAQTGPLSEDGAMPKQTDLIFDFAKRELRPRSDAWRITGPGQSGWGVSAQRAEVDPARRSGPTWRFEWNRPGEKRSVTLAFGAREAITGYTILPPWKPASAEPLLAVATWDDENGEPTLGLYLARTGRLVRQLKGHVQRIRGLAASPDGKLLASAADDQTVRVWSLRDIDDIIGRHGTIAGLTLGQEGNRAVVQSVQKAQPVAEFLKPGDQILGVALRESEVTKPPQSAYAVYETLWQAKPGAAAWVKVRRGGQELSIKVPVEQAVDDRKPLLSLLVLGAAGRPVRDWIAWTPAGLFDSSGADVERYVGWQFNPARLSDPVRYARLDAYRDRYYQPKLLKPLVDSGSLDEALNALKKPVPKPRVHIDALIDPALRRAIPVDSRGPYVLRSGKFDLQFTVAGPAFRDDEVKAVRVELDGALQTGALETLTEQSRAASLTFPKPRGEHRVRVMVENTEGQTAEADVNLVHQPPAPVIEFAEGQPSRTVRQKRFTLTAKVRPWSESQPVHSWLRVDDGGERELTSATEINREAELHAGPNVFRVRAVNEGALTGFEKNETAEKTVVVVFEPTAAPEARVTQIALPNGDRVDIEPGKPLVVDVPQIQVLGKITSAEDDLTGVELKTEPRTAGNVEQVRRFTVAAGARTFVLNADNSPKFTLQPAKPVDFTLEATTRNAQSPGRSLTVRVEYRPHLPELELTSPRADEERTQTKSDEAPPQVSVAGIIKEATPFHPFDVLIEVRDQAGKPVPQAGGETVLTVTRQSPAADRTPIEFATAQLGAGRNRVRVWLKNAWRTSSPVERTVAWLRPPLLRSMKASLPDPKKPFAAVEADLWSPPELPLTKISLNDREYAAADVGKRDPQAPGRWHIAINNVALARPVGDQPTARLVLKVANQEGAAEKLETLGVPLTDADKAQIDITSKTEVDKAAYRLTLHIESPSRLRSLEVFRDRRSVYQDFDPSTAADAQGVYHWDKDVELQLRPKANAIHVEAVNAAGLQEKQITVSYTPTPVQLVIDPLPSAPMTSPEVKLHGRVIWNEPDQEKEVEAKLAHLRAFVNGFRQTPPVLEPRSAAPERRFSFKLLLNQERNDVRIESPALPLQPGGRSEFTVACSRPRKPKLHVMVVQIANEGEKIPPRVLQERAFQSLGVSRAITTDSRGAAPALKSNVFEEVRLLPELRDDPYIVRDTVEREFARIKRELTSPSDVLLIYWVGKERIAGGEVYLLTHDNLANPHAADWQRDAVPLQTLLDVDQATMGARVVMLDVASDRVDQKPLQLAWSTIETAVLRYAWSKEKAAPLGLLQAMEQAAASKKRASLADVASAARDLQAKIRADVPEFMRHLWYLADLTVIQKE